MHRRRGLTLVELLISATIVGLVGGLAAVSLHTCLQAHAAASRRAALLNEGLLAMTRMTVLARTSTYLLVPNAETPERNVLALSGTVNDDDDFYFSDPFFPRIDEDPPADMNADGSAGIDGIDDDGDGVTDEGDASDDDEDGQSDEDPIDGIDNDSDGNVDEDGGADSNADGSAGFAELDDDEDGTADEGDTQDDDEDGTVNEDPLNPVVFRTVGAGVLREFAPSGPAEGIVLSERVSEFTVVYEPPDETHNPRIRISLTLTDEAGETLTFSEYVFPRNIVQRVGKRVR